MNANLPLVSICIPTYNGEQYLEAALQSAINQTYTNIEILIVDDCSTDNTRAIINTLYQSDGRIKLITNTKNVGLVRNWSNCIAEASGQWIKFLFQDDLLEPTCVATMLNACRANNTEFAICNRTFILEQGISDSLKITFSKKIYTLPELFDNRKYTPIESATLLKTFITQNILGEPICLLFSKKIYNTVNGFNYKMKQLVDYHFTLKLILNNNVAIVTEPLVNFRVHNTSTSSKNEAAQNEKTTIIKNIQATEGDHIQLLDCILNDSWFYQLKQHWAASKLELLKQRYYYKACKNKGKQNTIAALTELLTPKDVDILKQYNFIKYLQNKYLYNKKIKPYLASKK